MPMFVFLLQCLEILSGKGISLSPIMPMFTFLLQCLEISQGGVVAALPRPQLHPKYPDPDRVKIVINRNH